MTMELDGPEREIDKTMCKWVEDSSGRRSKPPKVRAVNVASDITSHRSRNVMGISAHHLFKATRCFLPTGAGPIPPPHLAEEMQGIWHEMTGRTRELHEEVVFPTINAYTKLTVNEIA